MSATTEAISSRPALAVPPFACDCHTHVFGPATRYAYAAGRQFTPGDASLEDLLQLQADLGLSRVVIVQPSSYGSDNRCTLDAVVALNKNAADRARAVVVIDEQTTDTELDDMHIQGARGVRLNLQTRGLNDVEAAGRMLIDASRRVERLGWHVQVFTNLKVIVGLSDVVGSLRTPVVFDHFAGARAAPALDQPGMDALMDLLRGGNVYIKLSAAQRTSSAPGFADVQPLARAWIASRPDRMLWGTDWPHPGVWPGIERDPGRIEPFHDVDDVAALNRLAAWAVEDDIFKAILVDNPARLYGW